MKRIILALALSSVGLAQPILGQTVSVSGTQTIPAIATATAGSEPNSVTTTSGSTTYGGRTPDVAGSTWSIRVRLSAPLPAGLTLRVKLTPSANAGNGITAGIVTLTTTEQDAVTDIARKKTLTAGALQYTLSATVAAGIKTLTTCTGCVVFTMRQ